MSQAKRLATAITYIVLLLVLGAYLAGGIPSFGLDGLWLYAAAATVLLNSALQEPHYTRPADALVNGAAMVLAVAAVNPTETSITVEHANTIRALNGVYGIAIILASALAIFFKDASGWRARTSGSLSRALRWFGRATLVFGILYFSSVWMAFADGPAALFILCVAWSAIFVYQPVEAIVRMIDRRVRQTPVQHSSAVIETLQDPQLVELRLPSGQDLKVGSVVRIDDFDLTGRVVGTTTIVNEQRARLVLSDPHALSAGATVTVSVVKDAQLRGVAGFVGPGSGLEEIVVISVPSGDDGSDGTEAPRLSENRLLSVSIHGHPVLYQAVEGVVAVAREPGARRGHFEVRARKLGRWNDKAETFDAVEWLPDPGELVSFVGDSAKTGFDERWIGRVAGTEYGVGFDVHGGITHNTAVLGILGIGKTTATWELINRMLAEGVKVLVLDSTDQYQREFADLYSEEQGTAIQDEIAGAISGDRENRDIVNGEAGNIVAFRTSVREMLKRFVDGESRLFIFNPLAFDVTRIDMKSFNEAQRTLTGLTAAEVTRIISESVLELLRERFVKDDGKAKLCLVLEEAHSLVPEWNAAAEKSEEYAVVGTVRAILQGRKYGYGCLVVTQRTAHVTKSILNQCNSIVAMRVFDATGMDFLANYIGRRYTSLLATLQPRQAVVFGRAFRSTAPLIVEFNDRYDEFLPGFWDSRAKSVPPTTLVTVAESAPAQSDPADDVPF